MEEFKLRLDEPVDELLPELSDRRVLVDARGPNDGDTVAAERPITLHDVLTFQLGIGMDFSAPWPQPFLDALAELELGAGPPEPADRRWLVAPYGEVQWVRNVRANPSVTLRYGRTTDQFETREVTAADAGPDLKPSGRQPGFWGPALCRDHRMAPTTCLRSIGEPPLGPGWWRL